VPVRVRVRTVTEIRLVDVSLRDGNQSLWGAAGLRTAHIATIAPVLGRVGFRALDYSSSTAMGMSVRRHREDPWALLRISRAAMPDTPLQFIGTGFRFISWERAHPEVIELVYRRLVDNGMDRFVVLDPSHDMDAARATARIAKKAGGREVIGALTYTISAVHDDAFYAGIAAQYAACADIDRAYIKDPAGILTPDRARTLIPAVQAALGGKPLELHSHATLGLSQLTCLTAASLGVQVLQVGCGALGDGSSLPDAERLVANLRASGHTVDVDDRLLAAVARYFDRLAAAEDLPPGTPGSYDAAFMDHQLAGGTMSTTRRQLAELGLADRFGALMAEIAQVRAELGYPIMVTPYPQMVIGQALANLLSVTAAGRRYDNVPDQVIRYAQGTFGKPTAPIDPGVLDRVLGRPRAAELAGEPPPLTVAELRQRFGGRISDEELLLRFGMPGAEVDAMVAAGPAVTHYNPDTVPVLKLLHALAERPAARELTVAKPGFRLSLRSNGAHSGEGGERS
jgi:oxaloacetate decarboxylase alpha subunit